MELKHFSDVVQGILCAMKMDKILLSGKVKRHQYNCADKDSE